MAMHTCRLFAVTILSLFLWGTVPCSAADVEPAGNVSKYYKSTGPLVFAGSWGLTNGSDASIHVSGGIGVHPSGDIFITSGGLEPMERHRVMRFRPDGTFVSAIFGQQTSSFVFPSDVEIAPDGSIFVISSIDRHFYRFSPQGKLLDDKSAVIDGGEPYDYPSTIIVAPDKSIYVICYGNNRVNKFTWSGKGVWSKGEGDFGDDDNEMKQPLGGCLGLDQRLYIADTNNERVAIITTSGALQGFWWHKTSGSPIVSPRDISQGIDANFYTLADEITGTGFVQRIDREGHELARFAQEGDAGFNRIFNPMALTTLPDGRLAVLQCDFTLNGKSRVSFWRPEYYTAAGTRYKITGAVHGATPTELANIYIVLRATDPAGGKFFASVRPAANGTFAFKKVAAGSAVTMQIMGFNAFVLKSEPAGTNFTLNANRKGVIFTVQPK